MMCKDVLDEQLAGLAKAHPSLTLHQDPVYVTELMPRCRKSRLLSGGGSGHEPMHCGISVRGCFRGPVRAKFHLTDAR